VERQPHTKTKDSPLILQLSPYKGEHTIKETAKTPFLTKLKKNKGKAAELPLYHKEIGDGIEWRVVATVDN